MAHRGSQAASAERARAAARRERREARAAARSWTPVRQGRRYCSPACGGGCTHAEYVRATHAAEAMVRRLGTAWRPRVWENLGWHWQVHLEMVRGGRVELRAGPGPREYRVMAGRVSWGRGRTPAQALRAALDSMREVLAPDLESLTALRRVLGE